MAFQILTQPGTVGQGIGLGLSSGLQALASQKLAQVQQQNERNQLAQLLMSQPNPLSQSQAQLIASLPVNQRFEALQGIIPAGIQQAPVYQQQEPTQTNIAQEQQAQPLRQAKMQKPRNSSLFDLGQETNKIVAGLPSEQINPADMIKQLQTLTGQKPNPQQVERVREIVNDLNTNPQARSKLESDYAKAVANKEMIELRRPNYFGPAVPLEQALQQSGTIGQPVFQKNLTESQRLTQERADRKEQKTEQKEADKETKQFYIDTTKQAEAAQKSEKRLDRMEQLINKGSLPFSTFYNLQKNLSESEAFKSIPVLGGILDSITHGVGFGIREVQRNVTSRDLEEFEKLSNQFIDQAKAMFGSRVTDADLKAFMATVPALSQSDAGKKQIIESMRAANEAAIIKANAMKQIIRENGNKRPADLEILVEDRTKDELDKLAREFIQKPTLGLF